MRTIVYKVLYSFAEVRTSNQLLYAAREGRETQENKLDTRRNCFSEKDQVNNLVEMQIDAMYIFYWNWSSR